ncbi:MAG: SUF system Fe-S cluster assembly regulator [Gammaproteobacteria bacterium]
MLRLTKLADYATVIMVYMAHKAGAHNARDIAAHTHIALPTVSKILKLLAKYNLLLSQRGVKGGYMLAREPKDISITDIIVAIDGNLAMTDCHTPGTCNLEPLCSLRPNWHLLSHIILKALAELSLADMAKPITTTRLASVTPKLHPDSLNKTTTESVFIDNIKVQTNFSKTLAEKKPAGED